MSESTRCARDSDWCDGVICRQYGINCPNADPVDDVPMNEHDHVVLPWLAVLPWKQQSIFFSSLRGPDRANVPAIKRTNRWMRSVAQNNADPSKGYMAL